MHNTSMFSTLKELVSIPSHSGDEQEIAQYISDFASQYATSHEIVLQRYSDRGYNVLGLSIHPDILVDVHLDTVPPGRLQNWTSDPFELVQRDNTLVGLGVLDNKAGIAICLELLKNCDCSRLSFSFCGSEETDATGLRYAIDAGSFVGVSQAVVVEPTKLDVLSAHKGVGVIRIIFTGSSAHASNPDQGNNAIYQATSYIETLKQKFHTYEKIHTRLGRTTYSVGTIRGGVANNIVPDRCEIAIDVRFIPGQTQKEIVTLFTQIAEVAKLDVQIIPDAFAPPMEYPKDGILPKLLMKTGTNQEGVASFWAHSGILDSVGIPSVVFGPGDISYTHRPDEHTTSEEHEEAYDIVKSVFR